MAAVKRIRAWARLNPFPNPIRFEPKDSVERVGEFRNDARVGEGEGGLPDESALGPEASGDESEKHCGNPSGDGGGFYLLCGAFVT